VSPYHILSLDGGGIRSLLSAVLLERLEASVPGYLSRVGLFAGTSAGAILALSLASGMSSRQARQLYEKCACRVFADSLTDDLRDLGNLIGAEYAIEPLKEVLDFHFGDRTLGDLPKRVLVSAFDLDNNLADPKTIRSWKPKFFHNFPGEDTDCDERIVDVAIRSCAAPVYFPIYQGYIDGGVVASNPSMCALAQVIDRSNGGKLLIDLRLLSIGTGKNPKYLHTPDGNWGLYQWAPILINLILDGNSDTVDYQCRKVLGNRYFRVNPILPYPISLDQVDQIPSLKQVAAQQDLSAALEWLKNTV